MSGTRRTRNTSRRTWAVVTVLAVFSVALAAIPVLPAASERAESRSNMRLLAQNRLGGFGNGGEGFALKRTRSGRRILYVAHEAGPKCFSVLDVTRPRRPRLLRQVPVRSRNVRCNSLDLSGDTLAVAHQVDEVGQTGAGLRLYDVSTPTRARPVGFLDTSGPASRGAHYVWFADRRYAHISTGARDFVPRRLDRPDCEKACHDQIYMIVDLRDPANPREVGRWWYPGTREGDAEPPPRPQPGFGSGVRLHNVNVFPRRPNRAYLAYLDGGVVILDIADPSAPRPVEIRDYTPPAAGFTHTALPLFGRDLLVVTDEAIADKCADAPKSVWVMDFSVEANVTPLATAPFPRNRRELCRRGGRFGAHNVHENVPDEPAWRSERFIVTANFNAGVRVYDLKNRFRPEEVTRYVPAAPRGSEAKAIQINDVYVDDRRIVYATDRFTGGLYVLSMNLPGRGR